MLPDCVGVLMMALKPLWVERCKIDTQSSTKKCIKYQNDLFVTHFRVKKCYKYENDNI